MKMKFYALCLSLCVVCLGASVQTSWAQNNRVHKEQGNVTKNVWSGYWWPIKTQQILQPLAKYDAITGAHSADAEKAAWPPAETLGGWEGLCHGWAASSVMDSEPRAVIPVNGRNFNLGIGDQKGWLAVAHSGDSANSYGTRCNDLSDVAAYNDMSPELLISVLRYYVGDQHTSVVLDLEPGPQVWNYPVYAYRLQYQPAGGNNYRGILEIWAADDGVAPDYVGLTLVYRQLPFTIQMNGSDFVVGSGRWVGVAQKRHPDFAWVPYVIQSDNPELSYAKVCEILNRNPGTNPPEPEVDEVDTNDEPSTDDQPDDVQPVADDQPSNNDQPNDDVDSSEETIDDMFCLEYPQLVQFLSETHSDFQLSINVIGGHSLEVGNELKFVCRSYHDGYLYVFAIEPDGKVCALYPRPGDSGFVSGDKGYEFPVENSTYVWRACEPTGLVKLVAFVTENPIAISGVTAFNNSQEVEEKDDAVEKPVLDLSLSDLAIRVNPSEEQVAKDILEQDGKDAGAKTDSLSERIKQRVGLVAKTFTLVDIRNPGDDDSEAKGGIRLE
ncbi:MAG: DUF4384 domain-containing protein [Planctomycetia bacterium]|nr:DUF4384 domain-containing protein [Planctomycetia bacterium]